MRRWVLVLGKGEEVRGFINVLGKREDLSSMQVAYELRKPSTVVDAFCDLSLGNEVKTIKNAIGNGKVVGVLNRVDSYIPLHGMLVEAFGIPGPSYESVMKFKDKEALDLLMRKIGLSKFRPNTKVVKYVELEAYLRSQRFPLVVKPYMGSKSRGVFFVDSLELIKPVVGEFEKYFSSRKMFRSFKSEDKVLVEEYVEGKQLTYTAYINSYGKLFSVGMERVITGREFGYKNQQLIFRTTPTNESEFLINKVKEIVERLINETKLKSTFVHTEFKYDGKRLSLIEVNVRIGGFRSELYFYSKGINLRKIALELALGKEVSVETKISKSVTAVEVWSDNSGLIRNLKISNDPSIKDLKISYKEDDIFLAPPEGDEPIAKFFVVMDENSFDKAKQIYNNIELKID